MSADKLVELHARAVALAQSAQELASVIGAELCALQADPPRDGQSAVMEMATELLREGATEGKVILRVCPQFKLPWWKITGRGGGAVVRQARQVAAYLLHEAAHMSYPEIGRLLDNRDHSTVITLARKGATLCGVDRRASAESTAGERRE